MKTGNLKGMSFGFSAVNVGQRNVNVEPQVIATSTEGGFRITPPVSKALNVGHGENIMFITNVDNIDAAIASRNEELVAFCEEQGLEFGTPEATIAIHKEFDLWGIAKGIQEFDTKGNAKYVQERLSKKDKINFVNANFEAMFEEATASEDCPEEVKDALTREGVTRDEQVEILTQFVQAKEVKKYRGSKAANAGKMIGAGTSLTFTDGNVWAQLKVDMSKEEAVAMNRIYDVDVENPTKLMINNGYEDVEVSVLILGEYTDKEATRIGKSDEE